MILGGETVNDRDADRRFATDRVFTPAARRRDLETQRRRACVLSKRSAATKVLRATEFRLRASHCLPRTSHRFGKRRRGDGSPPAEDLAALLRMDSWTNRAGGRRGGGAARERVATRLSLTPGKSHETIRKRSPHSTHGSNTRPPRAPVAHSSGHPQRVPARANEYLASSAGQGRPSSWVRPPSTGKRAGGCRDGECSRRFRARRSRSDSTTAPQGREQRVH